MAMKPSQSQVPSQRRSDVVECFFVVMNLDDEEMEMRK
jgi:hypothetical protein